MDHTADTTMSVNSNLEFSSKYLDLERFSDISRPSVCVCGKQEPRHLAESCLDVSHKEGTPSKDLTVQRVRS